MEIEQLTALDAMWDKGTNLHHALLLASRHFRKRPNAQPVLLIVTDGEPTSPRAGREVLLLLPAAPADGRVRRPRARQRQPARRADDLLLGGDRAWAVHRPDGAPGRRPGGRAGARRPRCGRGRLLPLGSRRPGGYGGGFGGGYGDWFAAAAGVLGRRLICEACCHEVPPVLCRAAFLGPVVVRVGVAGQRRGVETDIRGLATAVVFGRDCRTGSRTWRDG